MTQAHPEPELSRPIHLHEVTHDGMVRRLEASPEERMALARRFAIAGINALSAELVIRRMPGRQIVAVEGQFSARVVQECVVTLEPFETLLGQEIDERFVPAENAEKQEIRASEEEDFDEPIGGDTLDLGEIVAQCLSLALDPYPRKEGAALELQEDGGNATGKESPFAELARLKRSSK